MNVQILNTMTVIRKQHVPMFSVVLHVHVKLAYEILGLITEHELDVNVKHVQLRTAITEACVNTKKGNKFAGKDLTQ